ncbi:hypothetical protein [Cronobacter dublinensis]|nr:hypothetical protein [Cronobacter dublinensis]
MKKAFSQATPDDGNVLIFLLFDTVDSLTDTVVGFHKSSPSTGS